MSLRIAFRARLVACAPLAALLDTYLGAPAIFWDERPQDAPIRSLRLTKIGPGRDWTHDGPDPLINPRVQIDIYGGQVAQCDATAEAVQAEMERTDAATFAGWRFLPPAIINTDLDHDPVDLPGGGKAFLISHDYSFWARPA